jgi:hypothetical protein
VNVYRLYMHILRGSLRSTWYPLTRPQMGPCEKNIKRDPSVIQEAHNATSRVRNDGCSTGSCLKVAVYPEIPKAGQRCSSKDRGKGWPLVSVNTT